MLSHLKLPQDPEQTTVPCSDPWTHFKTNMEAFKFQILKINLLNLITHPSKKYIGTWRDSLYQQVQDMLRLFHLDMPQLQPLLQFGHLSLWCLPEGGKVDQPWDLHLLPSLKELQPRTKTQNLKYDVSQLWLHREQLQEKCKRCFLVLVHKSFQSQ